MVIESIQIEGLGRFRDGVVLGPLQPGLNILAQPNEWGKSTVLHALCHALFDRYNSQTEEIRQLRPVGSSLSPSIELSFHAKADFYRLSKRFLDGRKCELSRWDGAAWARQDEGDRADQRVRELLGAPALDGRTSKPETWGMVRYLWCRQDEPAEWPCWDGDCGEAARARLATVEIDSLLRTLACRLEERAKAQFTDVGRVRKGSPLQLAEAEILSAESELAALQQKRAEGEDLERQFSTANARLPRLEIERTARIAEASARKQEAEACEKLLAEIKLAESEWKRADAALQAIRQDRDGLKEIATTLETEATAQATASAQLEQTTGAVQVKESALSQARETHRSQQANRGETKKELERTRALLDLQKQAETLREIEETLGRVKASAGKIAECEDRLKLLPALREADLKVLRERDRDLGRLRARLEASGLTVQLKPIGNATILAARDEEQKSAQNVASGEMAELRAARSLSLEIDGWGRLEITSGAEEIATLQTQLHAEESALAKWLAANGVASLAAAESAWNEAESWRKQIEISKAELTAHLAGWKTERRLTVAQNDAVVALKTVREQHGFTAEDETSSQVSLRTREAELIAAEERSARDEIADQAAVEQTQLALDAAREQRAACEQRLAVSRQQCASLQKQRETIVGRYPTGIDSSWSNIASEFTRSEARLSEKKNGLPPDAEKLEERAIRATRAAVEVEEQWTALQAETARLRTLLEARGGEPLHSQEAAAIARLEDARLRAASYRREGQAARLLGALIQQREQGSIRRVLKPLEDRLSQMFESLTGELSRRVWFDEHLAIRGIGHRESELVPFDSLSRGAREQLLLALRAAIALEVTQTEGRQCLVLDDVLTHTDAIRHENVLDFLQGLAASVQIILLTCHEERYRGLGSIVPVARK